MRRFLIGIVVLITVIMIAVLLSAVALQVNDVMFTAIVTLTILAFVLGFVANEIAKTKVHL